MAHSEVPPMRMRRRRAGGVGKKAVECEDQQEGENETHETRQNGLGDLDAPEVSLELGELLLEISREWLEFGSVWFDRSSEKKMP